MLLTDLIEQLNPGDKVEIERYQGSACVVVISAEGTEIVAVPMDLVDPLEKMTRISSFNRKMQETLESHVG